MSAVINLPEWAVFKLDEKGKPIVNGVSHVINILTHVAYPAILREYKALYDERVPDEFKADGKLKKEWADCLGNLDPEKPTAYWMEVAQQTAKLDIQVACRTFALNLTLKDPGKKYRQADAPKGRDPRHAAGGGVHVKGKRAPGREARDHYKRLRGFVPA
ncbi:MAG: hypothetical protein V3T08_09580 [Gemmatimonadota bacterium]